jgi:hypothetical protein
VDDICVPEPCNSWIGPIIEEGKTGFFECEDSGKDG